MADTVKAIADAADKFGPYVVIAVIILVFGGLIALAIIGGANWVVKWNSKLVDQVIQSNKEIRQSNEATHELANKFVSLNEAMAALSDATINRNTVAANANTEASLKIAAKMDDLIDTTKANNEVTRKNAEAVKELTEYMKKFGSDPTKMCRLQMFLDENHIDYKPEHLPMLLKRILKEAEDIKAQEKEPPKEG